MMMVIFIFRKVGVFLGVIETAPLWQQHQHLPNRCMSVANVCCLFLIGHDGKVNSSKTRCRQHLTP